MARREYIGTQLQLHASKILGSVQILEFKLKCLTLNHYYILHLRPIFESGTIV